MSLNIIFIVLFAAIMHASCRSKSRFHLSLGYYAVGSIITALVWAIYIRFKRPGLLKTLVTTQKRITLPGGNPT